MPAPEPALRTAKEAGDKFYFTGKPCINGHIAPRYAAGRGCVDCTAGYAAKYPERIAASAKKFREANRELTNGRSREWRLKYPDRQKRSERNYRENNREYIRRVNLEYYHATKERTRAISKAWCAANKPLIAAKSAKRRAAKRKATPVWASVDKMLEIYQAAAWMTANSGEVWHVDHIVPLRHPKVCGLHCEANLQILPEFENLSKGNRHWPDMFAP